MTGDPLLPDNWHADPWDQVTAVSDDSLESMSPELRQLRGVMRTVAIVLASSLLLLGCMGWWTARVLNPSGAPGVAVNFTVNDGDTFSTVASRLQSAGIISNSTLFRWYVSTKGTVILTPGYYALQPKDNAGSIIETLSTPPAQTFISVTFPEGMTVAQMAQRLSEKMTFMSTEEFVAAANSLDATFALRPKSVKSLEGLLFPDTYQISGDDTEPRVVARLASMMERVARQVDLAIGAKARGFRPYEILIIASLIEREAKVATDRSKIAQVIYNRLAKKMKLEIDASVKYGQDPAMTWTDMKATDTPYNTYINAGLPPTPITNPGKASIQAALAPFGTPPANDHACVALPAGMKCEYLYYVLADAAGGHVFATTYDQHLQNVEKAKTAGLLP